MRLCPSVYLVGSGSAGFNLTHLCDCNVYLLDAGSEQVLIDAGAGIEAEQILANIRADGFALHSVSTILVTHGHADHAGGTRALHDACGARVAASELTARYLREGDETAISLDAGKRGGVYPPDYHFQACPVELVMEDNETLHIGKLTVTSLYTPGHCDGHTAFLVSVDGAKHLFSGDAVFTQGRIALQNIWDCRIPEYAATITKLAHLDDVKGLFPGHHEFSLQNSLSHIIAAQAFFDRNTLPPSVI